MQNGAVVLSGLQWSETEILNGVPDVMSFSLMYSLVQQMSGKVGWVQSKIW